MKSTYTQKLEKMLVDHQTVEGEQPLAFLVKVYQNAKYNIALRVEAARAAAVYVHRKMPQAVELKADVPISVVTFEIVGKA